MCTCEGERAEFQIVDAAKEKEMFTLFGFDERNRKLVLREVP